MISSFITNRLSRKAVYSFCFAFDLYEDFLDDQPTLNGTINRFFKETSSDIRDNQINRDRLNIILSRAILKDFTEIFNEIYFAPAKTIEMEELRRHETMYLLGLWFLIWSVFNLIGEIILLKPIILSISILMQEMTLDLSSLTLTITGIVILGSFVIFLHEKNAIKDHLLEALPLYLKPEKLRNKAKIETINEILLIDSQKTIPREFLKRELENEILESSRHYYIKKLTFQRLKLVLDQYKEIGKSTAKQILNLLDEERSAPITRPESFKNNFFLSFLRFKRIYQRYPRRFALIFILYPVLLFSTIILINASNEDIVNLFYSRFLFLYLFVLSIFLMVFLGCSNLILRNRRKQKKVINYFVADKETFDRIAKKTSLTSRGVRKILRKAPKFPTLTLIKEK